MKNKSFLGSLMLLLASFFWGSTFIVQRDAAELLPNSSFTYLAARSVVAAAALVCAILIRKIIVGRKKPARDANASVPARAQEGKETKSVKKKYLFAGVCCGGALAVAAALQQFGIAKGATAGEAGFLTALYMFIVPLFSIILYHRKPTLNLLFGALFMTAGLFFLCVFENGWSGFGTGHILIISCAVGYAVHIMVIDRFKELDGLMLSALQFTVCALLATVFALIFDEKVPFQRVLDAWFPIVYAGLSSSAVGFTLQIYGQKYAHPALATIFMSLESVIALLCEWLCSVTGIFVVGSGITMTANKIVGCCLAFIGIVLAQLPIGQLLRRRKKPFSWEVDEEDGVDEPEKADVGAMEPQSEKTK